MPFSILPIQIEDVPTLVQIYFDSFQNPHSLAAWPRVQSVRTWWEDMIRDELNDKDAHWRKVVDGDEIISFVKWVQPKPGVEPDIDLPQWPENADHDLCNHTFGSWARSHRELMGDRGHWYLEILATHPDHQGKGAGSKLMRYGLDQADQGGFDAYLEASPDAVPMYQKFGFEERARTDTFIDNERTKATNYTNLCMIRPAKAGVVEKAK